MYTRPPACTGQNGILHRIGRFLDALADWNSYRPARQPADIPKIIAKLTTDFFGLRLDGRLSPVGVTLLGAMLALHALEYATGAAVSLALRTVDRRPVQARHRGIDVRAGSPLPRLTRAWRWLPGSRLLGIDDCDFRAGGVTWRYQVVRLRIWGQPRTLAHLRSLSLPHRAHFFDRDISWQAAVELALGSAAPSKLPGHLGSINELEHAAGLPARAKLALIAARWLLIDPDERTAAPKSAGSAWAAWPRGWSRGGAKAAASPPLSGTQLPLVNATPAPPPSPGPAELIRQRFTRHGRSYPLLIRRIVTNPVTRRRVADAIYYDDTTRRWLDVTDDADRLYLAAEVDAGRLRLTPDWHNFL